jgi:hypothetical protein
LLDVLVQSGQGRFPSMAALALGPAVPARATTFV